MLVVFTAFGLLWVAETSKSQNGGEMPLSIERTSPYSLSLSLMGSRVELSLDSAEDVAAAVKKWGTAIVSRPIRLFLQWGEAARRMLSGEESPLPEPKYKNACLV